MKYEKKNCFKETEHIGSKILIKSQENIVAPIFSVVVPTYKRPQFLEQTILSIVNQDNFHQPYEIIVVDNEVGDESNMTELILQEMDVPNLSYYKNVENLGAVGNWNRCITLAKSNWIIMCHDDDLLKPNCLKNMFDILEKHKNDKIEVGYIRSSAESMYSDKLNIINKKVTRNRAWGLKNQTDLIRFRKTLIYISGGITWVGAPTCGTLINKKAIIEVGGYNRELSPCPDCYVPFHMLDKYGVYKTCATLGVYRWEDNDTYNKKTLLGLIEAYNDFLVQLSKKHIFVRVFEDEHYADCVRYYRSKGQEAGVVLSDDEINKIHELKYSKLKFKILLKMRKIYRGWTLLIAK